MKYYGEITTGYTETVSIEWTDAFGRVHGEPTVFERDHRAGQRTVFKTKRALLAWIATKPHCHKMAEVSRNEMV